MIESVFRQYDIRGIVGKDLDEEFYERLGKAWGAFLSERFTNPSCAVGRDVRESSARFQESFCRGLESTGCRIVDLGEVTTPMTYFAIDHLNVDAGAAITASHNPPEYNGAKFRVKGKHTLEPVTGLQIKPYYFKTEFPKGKGTRTKVNLDKAYVETVVEGFKLKRKLKVVIDGGNGIAGQYAVHTAEALGCEVVPLFCTPGKMEAHLANPVKPENYPWLVEAVKKNKADLGLMVDGDGDRLGACTRDGEIIWPDMLLLLFVREALEKEKQNVIVEVKCSQALVDDIQAHGGTPVFSPTGYTNIERYMHEYKCKVSGEMSGHFYFFGKKQWFSDANYTLSKLLSLVSQGKGLKEILVNVPSYVSSQEYRLHVKGTQGEAKKVEIVNELVNGFKKTHKVIDLDGGRVLFPQGWGLIRYSNNEPELSLRFEGKTKEALEKIKAEFRSKLSKYPEVDAAF